MNILEKIGFGICIGAVAGVTAGFIIGTKEGRMMRKTLKEKALNTIDNLEDHVQDGSKEWNATAAHVAEKANRVIRNIDEKADDLQQDLAHGYSKVKHDVKQTVAADTNQGKAMEKKWQDKMDETIDTVKGAVEEKADDISDGADHASIKVNRVVKDFAEASDEVGQEIKDGYRSIKHDMHRPGHE